MHSPSFRISSYFKSSTDNCSCLPSIICRQSISITSSSILLSPATSLLCLTQTGRTASVINEFLYSRKRPDSLFYDHALTGISTSSLLASVVFEGIKSSICMIVVFATTTAPGNISCEFIGFGIEHFPIDGTSAYLLCVILYRMTPLIREQLCTASGLPINKSPNGLTALRVYTSMVTTAPAARHISLNLRNPQRQISSLGSPVFSKAIEAIPEVLPSNHYLVTTSLTCPGGVCSTFVAAFLSLIRYSSAIPRKSESILSRISLVDSIILRPIYGVLRIHS